MSPLLRFTLDLFESAPPAVFPAAPSAPPDKCPDEGLSPAVVFRHPQGNQELHLPHARITYMLNRGKRRTIGFSVGPDGLSVRAPKWVLLTQVDAALRDKADWILRKLAQTQAQQQRLAAARIVWCDGAKLPFLGQDITLALDPRHDFGEAGAVLRAEAQPPVLCLALPHNASPEQIRDVVQAWLMRQAKRIFTQRLDHFAPLLAVQWRKLTLSNAGTRWGSAHVDGAIRLNWRLIHFRLTVVDYVVVHELSHLRVMNHSREFWDTVRSVMPHYATLRKQLKDQIVPG